MGMQRWVDLKTTDFADVSRDSIVVLPLAAIEQHGPHLSLDVDLKICDGLLAEAQRRIPDTLSALVMPTQAIGYSHEHRNFAGSLTLEPELLLQQWWNLIDQVQNLGFRRLVMFNSHGGNSDLMRTLARRARVACNMLAVAASWYRLVDCSDLLDSEELIHGIHGGALETSVMLHLAPEMVDMSKAGNFVSSAVAMARVNRHLSATGAVQFGWMSPDLHPSGAVGNASLATSAIGAEIVERATTGFLELLQEVEAFNLEGLSDITAEPERHAALRAD